MDAMNSTPYRNDTDTSTKPVRKPILERQAVEQRALPGMDVVGNKERELLLFKLPTTIRVALPHVGRRLHLANASLAAALTAILLGSCP